MLKVIKMIKKIFKTKVKVRKNKINNFKEIFYKKANNNLLNNKERNSMLKYKNKLFKISYWIPNLVRLPIHSLYSVI
jgi:hypothetical protein